MRFITAALIYLSVGTTHPKILIVGTYVEIGLVTHWLPITMGQIIYSMGGDSA